MLVDHHFVKGLQLPRVPLTHENVMVGFSKRLVFVESISTVAAQRQAATSYELHASDGFLPQ